MGGDGGFREESSSCSRGLVLGEGHPEGIAEHSKVPCSQDSPFALAVGLFGVWKFPPLEGSPGGYPDLVSTSLPTNKSRCSEYLHGDGVGEGD